MPLFYTALLIQLIYSIAKGQELSIRQVVHEVFFIQNYLPGFMNVTWSLGIEEQFYLLLALGMPFILKAGKSVKTVVYYCVAIMLFCFTLRITSIGYCTDYDPYKNFYPLHLRADSLCSGIVLSFLYHFKREKFEIFLHDKKLLISVICVAAFLPLFLYPYYNKFTYTAGFSFAYIGYFLLVALFLVRKNEVKFQQATIKSFIFSRIAWVGYYSYSIYLFHFFIGFGLVSNFRKIAGTENPVYIEFLIFLLGNILFGYIVSKVVEQPVLKWRDKRFPASYQKTNV